MFDYFYARRLERANNQGARMSRTPIVRADAIRFLRALFDAIGMTFHREGVMFAHPYRTNHMIPIPNTLEELLFLYQSFGQYHTANNLFVDLSHDDSEDDLEGIPAGEEMDESENDELSAEDSDEEEEIQAPSLVVEDGESEDDEEVAEAPPAPAPGIQPIAVPGAGYNAMVWLRWYNPDLALHGTHTFGPIHLSAAQYNILSGAIPSTHTERVNLAYELLGLTEGDRYPLVDTDAGVVGGVIPVAGHPRTRQRKRNTPPNKTTTSNELTALYEGTGYNHQQTRLSYFTEGAPFVDHPRMIYTVHGDSATITGDAEVLDPYLRSHMVENACWMTCIIEMVNTACKRRVLTYHKLWMIMERPGMFDPIEAQAGLCVEDMIPVFEYFDRNVVVVDNANMVVYERARSPQRRMNHIRPEKWMFLIREHHVYRLENQARVEHRNGGWIQSFQPDRPVQYTEVSAPRPIQSLSQRFPRRAFELPFTLTPNTATNRLPVIVMFTTQPGGYEEDDDHATLTELLFHPRFDKDVVTVLIKGSDVVEHALIPLVYTHKYIPTITFMGGRIKSMTLQSLSNRVMIVFQSMEDETAFNNPVEYRRFIELKTELHKGLLTPLMSTYAETTMEILQRFVRGGFFGWLDQSAYQAFGRGEDMQVSSIDVNRMYPSTIMFNEELPVLTAFDMFREPSYFTDEKPFDLLLIQTKDTSTIYLDRPLSLCFRHTFEEYLSLGDVTLVSNLADIGETESGSGHSYVSVVLILRCQTIQTREPGQALESGIVMSKMQHVWDQEDVPLQLRKLVLNHTIGACGTSVNRRYGKTQLFTTSIEAERYKEDNDAAMLSITPDLHLCQRVDESVLRLEGGYILFLYVLDRARLCMHRLHKSLQSIGVTPLYCRCDELYYPAEQRQLVLSSGRLDHGDHLTDSDLPTSGRLKESNINVSIRDNIKPRGDCIGPWRRYLDTLDANDCDFLREKVMYSTKTKRIVVPPSPNEYNIRNISTHKRLLITANVPGAGKSHAVITSCEPQQLLIVCPTNALCRTFETSYPGVTAMTVHRFLGINSKELQVFDQPTILTGQSGIPQRDPRCHEDGKILLLDEIFMYPYDLLVQIYFRLRAGKALAVYATGDPFQLDPIESRLQSWHPATRLTAITHMFPYEMQLTVCKRGTPASNIRMQTICEELRTICNPSKCREYCYSLFRTHSFEETVSIMQRGKQEGEDGHPTVIAYTNATCERVTQSVIGSKCTPGIGLVNRKRLLIPGNILHVNYLFTVDKVEGESVYLKQQPVTDPTQVSFKVPRSHVERHMMWEYTRTAHSLQGSSVPGRVIIMDLHHRCVTRAFIYVALTRAKNIIDGVSIGRNKN